MIEGVIKLEQCLWHMVITMLGFIIVITVNRMTVKFVNSESN